jgi:hypothetical protein
VGWRWGGGWEGGVWREEEYRGSRRGRCKVWRKGNGRGRVGKQTGLGNRQDRDRGRSRKEAGLGNKQENGTGRKKIQTGVGNRWYNVTGRFWKQVGYRNRQGWGQSVRETDRFGEQSVRETVRIGKPAG